MIKRTKICEFDGGRLAFYIETNTRGIHYSTNKRDVDFSVIVYSEAGESMTCRSLGTLDIFDRSYMMAGNRTLSAGETVLAYYSIVGLDLSVYRESAPCTMTLTYMLGSGTDCTGSYSAVCDLGCAHESPQLSVSTARTALGDRVYLSGDILSDTNFELIAFATLSNGYDIGVNYVSAANPYLQTFVSWIESFPNEKEFEITLRVIGRFGSEQMPQEFTAKQVLYLKREDALPSASIQSGFVSDYDILNGASIAVKNRSRLSVQVSGVAAVYGASITDIRVIYKGNAYYTSSFLSDIMTEEGDHSFTVKVIDSRGQVLVYSEEFTVLPYAPPVFIASVLRTNENGAESGNGAYVLLNATLVNSHPLDGFNEYSFHYRLARAGTEEYSEKTEFAEDSQNLINLSMESLVSYDLIISCEDLIGSVSEQKFFLECERIELNIAENKVGVGKYAQTDRLLDCAWDINSDGDITCADGNGGVVSLRSVAQAVAAGDGEGEEPEVASGVGFGYSTVTTAAELNALLSPEAEGVRIELIQVNSYRLTLSYGLHAVLAYNVGGVSGYKEIK